MKKIFYFLIAAFMMISVAANAQTVVNKGVFSNMYVGASAGADYTSLNSLKNFDANNIHYNTALEVGKNITPITGLSLEGIYNFKDNSKPNRLDVFANAKFNLMNLFGGYKGYPRRCEILTVGGIGWNHYFGTYRNPNDLGLQAGLEFDFNLGKNRNWFITFTPMVQANEVLQTEQIQYAVNGADLKANLGIAYRLGRGDKSHNLTICPYTYTDEQYADIYNKYDECINKPAVVDTVVIEKIVEVEKEVNNGAIRDSYVYFERGSSALSVIANKEISEFVAQLKDAKMSKVNVKVVGSADSKTGSKEFNEKIAWARANAVASELVKQGVNEVSTEIKIDIDENAEASRCAVIVFQ